MHASHSPLADGSDARWRTLPALPTTELIARELFGHALVQIDRVIQCVVDLAGDPDLIDGHPH